MFGNRRSRRILGLNEIQLQSLQNHVLKFRETGNRSRERGGRVSRVEQSGKKRTACIGGGSKRGEVREERVEGRAEGEYIELAN